MSEQYEVRPDDEFKRIDKLLTEVITDASRSQIQGWLKDKLVEVDGEAVKSNYKVQQGKPLRGASLNQNLWKLPLKISTLILYMKMMT